MNLVRLTEPTDEPIYLNRNRVECMYPSHAYPGGTSIRMATGAMVCVKEPPELVLFRLSYGVPVPKLEDEQREGPDA